MSSRFSVRSLLVVAGVTAFFAFGVVSEGSAVVDVECPCFDDLPPAIICFQNSPANSFSFSPPPANLFAQVTTLWCRLNGAFKWVTPIERMECEQEIDDACFGDDSDSESSGGGG